MKRLSIAFVLGFATAGAFHAQQGQSTSSIEGIVRETGTNRPVQGVKVTLSASSEPTFNFSGLFDSARPTTGEGITDAEGHFAIVANPGRYRVVPSKDGWVFAHPVPLQFPRESGTWVDLAGGDTLRDLQLQVQREGVISLRVLDSKGNSFPGTAGSTRLQVYRYDEYGKRILAGVPGISYPGTAWSFTRGDDRGEYRLYGLPPGDYYLSVTAGGSSAFEPGNTDEAHATPVHVGEGEEVRLGTITLPPPPPTTKVTLRFMRDGVPAELRTAQVNVLPSRLLVSTGPRTEFSFSLSPGVYDIVVTSGLGSFGDGGGWSRTKIVVGNTEVIQEVALKLGVRLKGNFSMDGVAMERPVACRLVGSEPFSLTACNNTAVTPGHYSFGLSGLPTDAYIKSAKVADRDILVDGIQIEADTQFDIQLGSHGAELGGTVTTSTDRKVAQAIVALVPDAPFRATLPLFKSGTTDTNGRFELRGIAPGAYHLFAWSELPGAAYLNAEFMKPYEELGKAVRVEKPEPMVVDVRIAEK